MIGEVFGVPLGLKGVYNPGYQLLAGKLCDSQTAKSYRLGGNAECQAAIPLDLGSMQT